MVMVAVMLDQRFRRAEHIRRPADFRRVYAGRASAGDDSLIVYALANELPHSRLGLSVSKKNGSAVVRNRIRRVLREAYRLSRDQFPAGYDVVVVVRSAEMAPLAQLMTNLAALICAATERAKRKFGRGHVDRP